MMWLRLLAIVALVLGSLTALAPTLFPSLDVALQGGRELVMEVDWEEAVRETVAVDAAFLNGLSAGGATIRIPGGFLEVVSEAPRATSSRSSTTLSSSVEPITSIPWVRDRAVERIVERTRQRLAAARCAGSTVEHIGGALVAVTIPWSMDCL